MKIKAGDTVVYKDKVYSVLVDIDEKEKAICCDNVILIVDISEIELVN